MYFLACKCWWFPYLLHPSSFVLLSPFGAAVRGKTSRERKRDHGRRRSRTRRTTIHQDRHCHYYCHDICDIDLSDHPSSLQLDSYPALLLVCCRCQPKTRHNIRRTLFSSHRAPCPSRQDGPPSRSDVDGPRPHDGTTILARQYRQHHKARRTVSVSYCLQPRPLDAIPTCPALARRVASSRSA